MPNTWHFRDAFVSKRPKLIRTPADDADDPVAEAAHLIVLTSLNEMQEWICEACSGYGHTPRYCPTHTKLTNLQSAGPKASHMIATIRKKMPAKIRGYVRRQQRILALRNRALNRRPI